MTRPGDTPMNRFGFQLHATDGAARRGTVHTGHGQFHTPAFMPVGTSGAVKALTCGDLDECGVEIILGNTYHLYLRPGTEIIKTQGGLAGFNAWHKPTLTDSGGFQVFSLKEISEISDEGVRFQSHLDGSYHNFTPERVMEIQHDIGADIIMAFDECLEYPTTEARAMESVRRTTAWAKRSMARHRELSESNAAAPALFGIVQGSVYPELRKRSAQELLALDFPGYAVGGLSVGEPKVAMASILAHTVPELPADKPRYLMGVGYPDDILMAVSNGIDMFDCVLPTRNARTGAVFTSHGQLVYRNADYARDNRPLDPNCDCAVCRRYSRAYLRHLYNQSEITGMILATYHSIYFYQKLMQGIRAAIEQNRFREFSREFLARYQQPE